MVKTNYKIIEKETIGDIDIIVNSQYNNIKADSVTVKENITARLFGTINKKLIIEKHASVFLHGIVNGVIENRGGELHIYK